MKILHTSDWHLGITLHNISLLDDQKHFIKLLTEIIKTEKIDAVIIAGDIFDSALSGAQAIELYNTAVTQICIELSVPLFIISGNHDGAARLSCAKELLKGAGLYVEGKVMREIKPISIENANIYLIPYFNTDEIRALFPELEIKSTEQAMNAICNEIRHSMDKSKVNIAVAHAFISGAELSSSDTSAIIGTASMISAQVFEQLDYVALGHLHRAQSINNARYSGSPLKYSAGEAGKIKSVTIFDTDSKEITEIPLKPIRDLRVITGELKVLLQNAQYCEDFVKLEITDEFTTLETLGMFKSFYPNIFAISGKRLDGNDAVTISANEVRAMTSAELITRFFDESFGYVPSELQIKMFEQALMNAETEEKGE